MANQSVSMANPQEDNVDQLKLVLNLNYSTRNQLINSLNDLSAILQCDEPIPEDAKQRTCTKIDQSMRLLVYLSPFGSSQSTEKADSDVFEERISGRLAVQLPRESRSSIVSHLIDLKDAVLFEFNREAKDSLVIESRRIVDQLLSLPCKAQRSSGAVCTKVEKKEENDEPDLKKQKSR